MPLDPARQAAFDVLRAVSERDAYANLVLPAMLAERGIHGRDAAFATELAYGSCRTLGLLDAVIAAAAGRPVEQIDPVLLDLLRLGSYQLLRTNVAEHAAVSTTVEQAGIEFDSVRAGFVNGVLRTISGRDEASWVAELAPAQPPTRSGTWRSCTPTPAGSPSRSPTRSAPTPANWMPPWRPTMPAPAYTSLRAPGC
jgi:16S rRNA (cytosine967-C5)-methyltransferase